MNTQRQVRGLSWTQVAAELPGFTTSMLTNLATGPLIGFPRVMLLTQWLGQPAAHFVRVRKRQRDSPWDGASFKIHTIAGIGPLVPSHRAALFLQSGHFLHTFQAEALRLEPYSHMASFSPRLFQHPSASQGRRVRLQHRVVPARRGSWPC